MLKIKVIIGSTRQNRFAEQPAQWIAAKAKEKGLDIEILDLKDYPLPFFEEPISPSMAKEPYSNPVVQKWVAKIAEADGFIITAAEYNHGYTAVLKNALDYAYREWNKKPVAFVGYGSVGGSRAIEQLRGVVAELQMVSIRNSVHMSNFWSFLDEQGKIKTESFEASGDALVDQLTWWASALQDARNKDTAA